jgi:hypothetical protein
MPHPNARLLLITGFLGGYTTFSTFENDNLTLWERGEIMLMGVVMASMRTSRSRRRVVSRFHPSPFDLGSCRGIMGMPRVGPFHDPATQPEDPASDSRRFHCE